MAPQHTSEKPEGLGARQLWKESQAAAPGINQWASRGERGRTGESSMVSEAETSPRHHRLFLATVPRNSKFGLQDMYGKGFEAE